MAHPGEFVADADKTATLRAAAREAASRPITREQMEAAKDAIFLRFNTGEWKPDIIDMMVIASEHVNTMNRAARMELRQFIIAIGGSLEVPADRMHTLMYPPLKDGTAPYQERKAHLRIVTDFAKPYNDPELTSKHCRFPVGVWRTDNPETNLCCGKRRATVAERATISQQAAELGSPYCLEHVEATIQVGSAANRKPSSMPPAKRVNNALKNRGKAGTPFFDSY
jgi:hypothetical protein